jgi:hypothetical protein
MRCWRACDAIHLLGISLALLLLIWLALRGWSVPPLLLGAAAGTSRRSPLRCRFHGQRGAL